MASIKFTVSQAKSINQYKNLRTKIMKCCANIYFNRQCLKKEIDPKYANIKALPLHVVSHRKKPIQ